MSKSYLLAATSVAALCAMLPAYGAEQQAEQSLDEVIVSASRINISGYEQPTPVTVVSTESLQRDAQTNLGGIFRALPSFGVANSPDTSANSQAISNGGAGTEQVSLRNLTPERTLVLVNGVRVVGTELGGGAVDLNMIPSMLVSRVDVVTGGASAAWGSDAIAGVVNFVMNDNFDGLQVSIDGANNHWLNKVTGKAQLAYGTQFMEGRGRFIVGASYQNSPLSPLLGDASWRKRDDYIALMPNPAYGTGPGQTTNTNQYFTAHNVGLATKTSGGLITSCQPATAACPLRGIQFVGPEGTPQPFRFGLVSGLFSWGGRRAGSDRSRSAPDSIGAERKHGAL